MKVDRNPTKPNALRKSNIQKTSSTYLNSRLNHARFTPPPPPPPPTPILSMIPTFSTY